MLWICGCINLWLWFHSMQLFQNVEWKIHSNSVK